MLTIMSLLLSLPALPIVHASASTFSFNLTGPNFSEAESGPFAGDNIRLTGSGSFTCTLAGGSFPKGCSGGSVVDGTGSFTHRHSDGALVAKGTWVAAGFVSFTSYGGPSNGFQGGLLKITVTLFPSGGGSVGPVEMWISCEINAPGGAPEEGARLPGAGFTEQISGLTLIHLNS